MTDAADAQKRVAAEAAVHLVEDNMVVGLGSGSTAELFLEALAQRVASGLRITGVPTSIRVGEMAQQRGISVVHLEDVSHIDLAVDGADEIEPRALDLIKGRGGALLREKLVATVADRLCIIADSSKLVTRLGEHYAVPVAVVPYGWRQTADRVRRLGGNPVQRLVDGSPLVTDDGLYVLDCAFGPFDDPARLAAELKGTLGIVEHGIFLGLAARAIVAGADGIVTLEPGRVVA